MPSTTLTPTPYSPTLASQRAYLDTPVSFVLDSDLRLACEDQAHAQGIPFEAWLQQTVNDALRSQLGV